MPIPTPSAGQTEEQYIGECIPAIIDEYGQEQAAAICYATYRKDKMNKIKDTSAKVMARVKYNADFRGINLFAEGGLEDICWEGYIAIGTKNLDGREVPNCVPIKEEASKVQMEKGIHLADYPWEQCVADMTDRYESEETAKKVCGYIKSEYGS